VKLKYTIALSWSIFVLVGAGAGVTTPKAQGEIVVMQGVQFATASERQRHAYIVWVDQIGDYQKVYEVQVGGDCWLVFETVYNGNVALTSQRIGLCR
jgi:hypothetical protein